MTKRATRATEAPRAASRQRSRTVARRSSFKKRLKTFLALMVLVVETAIAAVLACSLFVFQRFSQSLPNVEDLANDVRPPVATTIWSQDGELLGQLDLPENRQPITLDDMPKSMIDATTSIEDHRFYEHKGVDVQGIARAAYANFSGSRSRGQGGSTLTQQLVRNIDTFGLSKKKDYRRKLREALIAMRVEQVYSKREILALYLNNIYYGGGAYGVQAAALTYFGKSAYKLDISESALLAGLPQRPSAYSPFEHRRAALKRRDEVIDAMLKYDRITAREAEDAKLEELHFMPPQQHKEFNFKAPHFVWYVLHDLFRRYGASFVYSGLRIETTLNWKVQQAAEAQLEQGLQHSAEGNQGALIALDNATGYIRAMVGGRSFRASQFNNVTQGKRQPGSTFKLFDYTTAFDQGKCGLYDTFEDRPIPYPNDPTKVVKNFGGTYRYGPITCLTAIATSVNTVAVQVAASVGIKKVIEYAHKMGITTDLDPDLPTALGASAVRPIDLCSAYSSIADKGVRYHPMSLIRVLDSDGSTLEEHLPASEPAFLKPHTIEQIDQALEAVVTVGSGTRAKGDQSSGIVDGAHGKTGTTTDARDAWFAGYTPELTAVIWVANVHRGKHGAPAYFPMAGATGGQVCAPIWHDFMIRAQPEERKFLTMWRQLQNPQAQPEPDADAVNAGATSQAAHPKPAPKRPKSAPAAAAKPPNPNPAPPPGGVVAPEGDVPSTDGTPGPDQNTADPVTQIKPPTTTVPPPVSALPTPSTTSPPAASRLSTPNNTLIATRPSTPTRPSTTPRPATPPKTETPEMVDVTVCVDSGDRATDWCPATKTRRMTAKQARRLRRCRLHHAPS